MKRYLSFLSALLLFCSCNAFLDVRQKGTATDNELFRDVEGYRTAVLGVYASLASTNMYGRTLTYGFMDDVCMLYQSSSTSPDDITKLLEHDYKHATVRPTIDAIWSNSYKLISYVNNILDHLKGANFNESPEYAYFKGEMLAVRAYVHFDLLRIFCDDYIANPEAGGLPYSETYDFTNKKVYSLKDTFGKIIADLTEAERILTECEITNPPASTSSGYTSYRTSMMNVYAVKAELARVYQAMGDLVKSRTYADEVIKSGKFSLTIPEQYPAVKAYPASGELLWGLSNINLYTTVYNQFLNTGLAGRKRYPRGNLPAIYETSKFTGLSTDYRWTNLFKQSGSSYFYIRMLSSEATSGDDPKKLVTGVSLLRLPEMYYIASEGWYPENSGKAISYLNDVRHSRGLTNLPDADVNTPEKFKDELYKDRYKELWGEGQLFFDHKRLFKGFKHMRWYNYPSYDIKPSKEIFILPWPDAELEYGGNNN